MKRLLPLLFVIILLGCAPNTAEAPPTPEDPISTPEPASLYAPDSAIEVSTQGAVQTYILPIPDVYRLLPMGKDYLLFSGTDATTLTVLSGDGLYILESAPLEIYLAPAEPGLNIHEDGLSYFDPQARETVLLDASLSEIKRIAAPSDLVGAPILSRDGTTLFYCTSHSLRAWDLTSGIRRMVKEMTFPTQEIVALHLDDTVLQCRVTDETGSISTLFLSTENGRLLQEKAGDITLSATDTHYFATFREGILNRLLFGEPAKTPAALIPRELSGEAFYLKNTHAVVTVFSSPEEIRLELYHLDSGLRQSALTYASRHTPISLSETPDGKVLILTYDSDLKRQVLYLWDTEKTRLNDGTVYTSPYYTANDPDYPGLAQCQSYADNIGEAYGIEVKLWLDALEVLPWDYTVEAEHLVPVLWRELTRLEAALSVFPDGFLETTTANFTKLRISLVRSLTGANGIAAHGVQFFDGTDAHILLTPGEKLEQSLYHELYHVMETQIFNESIALDQWDKLNPAGFFYDYDYTANAQRDGSAYLKDETRSFIDTYSMSFPKEDRARILEYAMPPGHQALFQSSQMQAKLSQLCMGIREAYHLEKSEETFLWEQYLLSPLTP